MADLYLSTSQFKYSNSFTFYDYWYEYFFEYECEPIIRDNEITSYSFKPILNWVVADDEINVGYVRDNLGNPLSFIYSVDEIKDSMLNGTLLLECELVWNNRYSASFRFYDYAFETDIYSRNFSLLNYDLSYFQSGEIIENPYSDSERHQYMRTLVQEYVNENGRLKEENNNLKSTIAAPGSTFELFADAFKPVFDTLNIQIAPSITIGMILAVPIVAGILSFLLRETIK